ncbi:MAG: prepilin-type N-terminal cleavage/methylation domain-containing protein [Planctomycetes bacterium]|nr:prepilin-type N-terminal cleavage/methylation domain-containing protein [Planctomycetota bacterium]
MRRTCHKLPGGLRGLNRAHRAARFARSGFTLIEIVMVVMIMGLLIMMVAVAAAFGLRNKEQLKNEARQLGGFLEHVRTLSAINGRRYTVEYGLDEDEQRYFVWAPITVEEGDYYEGDDEEARKPVGFHDMPTRKRGDGSRVYAVWIDRIAFADGSSTTDSQVKIDFMPTGGAHWHYVYLTNEDEDFYTVVLNPFTGGSEIYPGEHKPPEPERLR